MLPCLILIELAERMNSLGLKSRQNIPSQGSLVSKGLLLAFYLCD